MSCAAVPVRRGCGSRKEGGVYLECGLSVGGSPIEAFLFDPPLDETSVPAEWLKPSRTPQLFERDGVHHVVIWVGEDFYPNVFDFIEETRVAGASRRVPSTFDFSKLSPASRMYFVHAHAAVDGTPLRKIHDETSSTYGAVPTCCPKGAHRFDAIAHGAERIAAASTSCLGLAKYLPTSDAHGYKTDASETARERTLPCGHSYALAVERPAVELKTRPAMFLQLPLTGIACVTKSDGSFDETVEQRVKTAAGVDVFKSAE